MFVVIRSIALLVLYILQAITMLGWTMPNAATYAKMHRKYLETVYPKVYQEMKKTGELTAHVAEAGRQAMQMYEALEAQMMARIHKEYQAPEDYMRKIKEMEQIPHVVEEIVLHEAVYRL